MGLIIETWYYVTCDFCGEEGPKTLMRWDEKPPKPNETMRTVPVGWNFCYLSGPKGPVEVFACPAHAKCFTHLIKTPLGKVS